MQKFNFLDLLIEHLENEDFYGGSYMNKYDKQKLNRVIKNQPILIEYHDRIKNGEKGEEYLKLT